MKLRTLPLAFLLILGVALGAASHANADYVLWTPTITNDQNVFSFTPQNCTMSGYLYINAVGATQDTTSPGSAVLLTMPGSAGNPFSAGETDFTIAQNGSNWYVYAGQTAGGNPLLNLGSTDQFGLYYYQQTGPAQYTVFQPVITNLGDPDDWLLNTPSGCLPVYLTDAAPTPTVGSATPIPATFLLFGSGLAGAIGFLRRFPG